MNTASAVYYGLIRQVRQPSLFESLFGYLPDLAVLPAKGSRLWMLKISFEFPFLVVQLIELNPALVYWMTLKELSRYVSN